MAGNAQRGQTGICGGEQGQFMTEQQAVERKTDVARRRGNHPNYSSTLKQ